MPVIEKVVAALTQNAGKNLFDGIGNIISKFKADPTKTAELDADLEKLKASHEESMAGISVQVQKITEENETQRIEAVNATMQAEAKSEHWAVYGWRPFIGFIFGLAFLITVILVSILAFKAVINGDTAAMNMIGPVIMSFTTLFGIPGAILGVTAWFRGKTQLEDSKQA